MRWDAEFEAGEYYVPEMLIAARAMQSGMAILKPSLQQTDRKSSGKVVIGTVKGDLHDIGKNLVALMLEGAGFEIKDLGVDVPIEEFIRVVKEEKPDIVGMSALLTTTMQMMKQTIDAFQAAGLRDRVKFMIGGAPVTRILCQPDRCRWLFSGRQPRGECGEDVARRIIVAFLFPA